MYHKLLAYGFLEQSSLLVHNYLSNRSQRVKIGSVVGEWMGLEKGTPQGSKLGPALWNLFINDLLLTLPDDSVVNFADDNTLYAVDGSPEGLSSKLNNIVNQAQLWYTENGMQPNPTKYQSIFFGKTPSCTVNVQNVQNAHNVTIEPTGFIKLLGVSVDNQLNFNTHITNVCVSAGRNLNVLKRVAKDLPTNVKLQLYNTYISCHFNFCPLVWHFCSVSDTNRLEKIQFRALRFVYDDYESDYNTLLARAKMPTLELSRQRALCAEVFKCINNLAPQYMCNLFKLRDKSIHNTKSVKALVQSHYNKVKVGFKTFVNYSTHLWNNLPSNIRASTDLETFKAMINTWYGPSSCKCYLCNSVQ